MVLLHAVVFTMGYLSGLTLCILTFVSCVVVVKSEPKCTTVCYDGDYCADKDCLPCPPRTFQNEPFHDNISCKPWTDKSRQPHYIIVENGTATRDVKWACEDGYEEKQYTVEAYECRLIPTTPSPVSSPTQLVTAETVVTTEPSTAASHVHQQTDSNNTSAIVGTLVVLAVIAVIAVITMIISWRMRILCFANNNVPIPLNIESGLSSENECLMPDSKSVIYKFCLKFVEELGLYKSVSFLEVLYDPSGKFDAGKVLQSELTKTPDVNTYLTKTFLKWVELNKGIRRDLITNALEAISRISTLSKVEELVQVNYIDGTFTDNLTSAANGQGPSSAGRVVLKQDRFRMYYYLTDKIQAASLMKLLTQLPDSSHRFNARYHFDGKLKEDGEMTNAFAHTFEEWCLRNPGLSLSKILTDFLTGEKRRDVLENTEFKDHLQRIDPAETGNSDSHHQVKCGSSGNLIPGEANQVSTTAEIEHISDDTGIEDIPNDTETEHMSDNTEIEHMPEDNEIEDMPDNTEVKQLADTNKMSHNTAVKQLPDTNKMASHNTVVKQLSDTIEMGHMPDDTAVKQVSDDIEMGCVSDNSNMEDVSNNTERRPVSHKPKRPKTERELKGKRTELIQV